MRAEGPLEWMVQALVVGPDERVAIHLGRGATMEDTEIAAERVRKAWGEDVRVIFLTGEARVCSVEMME